MAEYKRVLQLTADGSHTVAIPELNITYHSKYGALQESKHIFIQEGLQFLLKNYATNKAYTINILEAGFGIGLNALLSLQEAILQHKKNFMKP